MLKMENTEIVGWEHAIRGMRNPKNSWDRSDSCTKGSVWCNEFCGEPIPTCDKESGLCIGPNDHNLMSQLAEGGPVHAKYRRMIVVYVDITAPLYWWKEFDTYKIGTVANSCSTMHKIADKEFTKDDFSHEHLWGAWDIDVPENEADTDCYLEGQYAEVFLPFDILEGTIKMLNKARELFLETNNKKYWWQMIQLLPSSYNQKRTVMLNYEVLVGIYKWRHNHKLDEWRTFCNWIENLPYNEFITGRKE